MFFGCTVARNSKETERGSRNQETSPAADKNTKIVLVPCLCMEVHPAAISGGVDISKVPGCHLLQQMSSH